MNIAQLKTILEQADPYHEWTQKTKVFVNLGKNIGEEKIEKELDESNWEIDNYGNLVIDIK